LRTCSRWVRVSRQSRFIEKSEVAVKGILQEYQRERWPSKKIIHRIVNNCGYRACCLSRAGFRVCKAVIIDRISYQSSFSFASYFWAAFWCPQGMSLEPRILFFLDSNWEICLKVSFTIRLKPKAITYHRELHQHETYLPAQSNSP
jgi:hypothetical protein